MKHIGDITNKQIKAHCLFEQAGTFKNEFKQLGIPCEDYDILNDFGETDNQVDLFQAIMDSYEGRIAFLTKSVRDICDMSFLLLAIPGTSNCADCPCCTFGEHSIFCQANDDEEICTLKEYYSHRKLNLRTDRFEGEYTAPRPKWCPMIELKEPEKKQGEQP